MKTDLKVRKYGTPDSMRKAVKDRKRLTSMLLILAMLITLGITPAYAADQIPPAATETPVAETSVADPVSIVGGITYQTLEAAVTAAADGATITLNADTTLMDNLVLNKQLTIEGNAHTLTVPAKNYIEISKSVTLQNMKVTQVDDNVPGAHDIFKVTGGGTSDTARNTLLFDNVTVTQPNTGGASPNASRVVLMVSGSFLNLTLTNSEFILGGTAEVRGIAYKSAGTQCNTITLTNSTIRVEDSETIAVYQAANSRGIDCFQVQNLKVSLESSHLIGFKYALNINECKEVAVTVKNSSITKSWGAICALSNKVVLDQSTITVENSTLSTVNRYGEVSDRYSSVPLRGNNNKLTFTNCIFEVNQYSGSRLQKVFTFYSGYRNAEGAYSKNNQVTFKDCTFTDHSKTLDFFVEYELPENAQPRENTVTATGCTLTGKDNVTLDRTVVTVVQTGGVALKKDSLAEAVATNPDAGNTIRLDSDCTISPMEITKNTILDLNGHTLQANGPPKTSCRTAAVLHVKNDAVLTIRDSSASGAGKIRSNNTVLQISGGEVILESGTIEGGYGACVNGNEDPETWATPRKSLLTVKGGTIRSTDEYAAMIWGNGAAFNMTGGAVIGTVSGNGTNGNARNEGGTAIQISGGSIDGNGIPNKSLAALYHPQAGVVKITGGTFTGSDALSVQDGTWTISGGTFISTGPYKDPALTNSDGTEETGACVTIISNDAYTGAAKNDFIDVTITGGKFTSTNGYALYEGIAQNAGKPVAAQCNVKNITITGGTFAGDAAKGAVRLDTYKTPIIAGTLPFDATIPSGITATVPANATLTVAKGATLTVASGATLTIAPGGAVVIAEGGKYAPLGTVTGDVLYQNESKITAKNMAELQKALRTITKGGTITLAADFATGSGTFDVNAENLTIDGGGKTITGTLNLRGAGAAVKNLSVTGNVVIMPSVGDGNVKLDGVIITNGILDVRGGGKNAVILAGNTNIPGVTIHKDTSSGSEVVRIVVEPGVKVDGVTVNSEGNVQVNGTDIGTIAVAAGAADGVSISGTGTVAKLDVTAGKVTVQAGATVTAANIAGGETEIKGTATTVAASAGETTVSGTATNVTTSGTGATTVSGSVTGTVATTGGTTTTTPTSTVATVTSNGGTTTVGGKAATVTATAGTVKTATASNVATLQAMGGTTEVAGRVETATVSAGGVTVASGANIANAEIIGGIGSLGGDATDATVGKVKVTVINDKITTKATVGSLTLAKGASSASVTTNATNILNIVDLNNAENNKETVTAIFALENVTVNQTAGTMQVALKMTNATKGIAGMQGTIDYAALKDYITYTESATDATNRISVDESRQLITITKAQTANTVGDVALATFHFAIKDSYYDEAAIQKALVLRVSQASYLQDADVPDKAVSIDPANIILGSGGNIIITPRVIVLGDMTGNGLLDLNDVLNTLYEINRTAGNQKQFKAWQKAATNVVKTAAEAVVADPTAADAQAMLEAYHYGHTIDNRIIVTP